MNRDTKIWKANSQSAGPRLKRVGPVERPVGARVLSFPPTTAVTVAGRLQTLGVMNRASQRHPESERGVEPRRVWKARGRRELPAFRSRLSPPNGCSGQSIPAVMARIRKRKVNPSRTGDVSKAYGTREERVWGARPPPSSLGK
jgi:hypothetical protein